MKERFLELTKSMVKDAVTKNLYIQFYRELYTICQQFKTTKWLDFWHERRAHYVPGFRGYGYPGLNLAEPGQSTMRMKRMTLVDAAFDDILKQMHQDELYAATLHNEVDGIGRQSKTVKQIMVECEAEQKKRALLYIKTLQEFKQTGEKLWQESPPTHDPEDPSYFIPKESASHKFIDPEETKKKSKSNQKRKVNQEMIQKPKKRRGMMWDRQQQLHVLLQRDRQQQLHVLLQRDWQQQLHVLLQRDRKHLRHKQQKKEKGKGKAIHQKHRLLLLLIPMIMDHLSQMQLKKHCWKLRFQIL